MPWDVAAILIPLALLMALAYRGLPVIVLAPLCATLAVILSGAPALPTYTESFMAGAADYVRMFFGTNIYAAPVVGLIGAAMVLSGGLAWLEFRRARALAASEGYGSGHTNEPDAESGAQLPHLSLALLPLLVVLATNFLLGRPPASIASWYSRERLRVAFPSLDVRAAAATWGLIVALLSGIASLLLAHHRRLRGRFVPSLTVATSGALLAIFNTASEVGFGHVIKTLPGFGAIRGAVTDASGHVLISETISVNVLAGITGSASGGLSIALEVMGRRYLEMARTQGISPELLHRIASMASGGMDTLPHNGAVITLLTIAGLTHRRSYPDIFALTLIKTAAVAVLAVGSS